MQPYAFPLIKGPPSAYNVTVTNYTDITGLTFSLVPGAMYLVQAWVTFAVTGTTTTMKLGLGYTGTDVPPTAYKMVMRTGSGDGGTVRTSPTIPDTGTLTAAIATAGTYDGVIDGLVTTSTSAAGGTLSVQIAYGTGSAAVAPTIAANSCMMFVQQIG